MREVTIFVIVMLLLLSGAAVFNKLMNNVSPVVYTPAEEGP